MSRSYSLEDCEKLPGHFQRGEKKNSMLINWNKNISIASVFVSLFNLFHHLFSHVTFITFIIPTCLQFPHIILIIQQLFVINPVKDIPIEGNQAYNLCMYVYMYVIIPLVILVSRTSNISRFSLFQEMHKVYIAFNFTLICKNFCWFP